MHFNDVEKIIPKPVSSGVSNLTAKTAPSALAHAGALRTYDHGGDGGLQSSKLSVDCSKWGCTCEGFLHAQSGRTEQTEKAREAINTQNDRPGQGNFSNRIFENGLSLLSFFFGTPSRLPRRGLLAYFALRLCRASLLSVCAGDFWDWVRASSRVCSKETPKQGTTCKERQQRDMQGLTRHETL